MATGRPGRPPAARRHWATPRRPLPTPRRHRPNPRPLPPGLRRPPSAARRPPPAPRSPPPGAQRPLPDPRCSPSTSRRPLPGLPQPPEPLRKPAAALTEASAHPVKPRTRPARRARNGPDALGSGARRSGPGPKDPPRHDHRPDASPSTQWHAGSWQASGGVTVVTERVFRLGDFTRPLQLLNLICAIARVRSPGGGPPETVPSGAVPPRPHPLRDAHPHSRTDPLTAPRRPRPPGTPPRRPTEHPRAPGAPEADRPPGSVRPARQGHGRALQGIKNRAGPGGVQRDQYDDTRETQV